MILRHSGICLFGAGVEVGKLLWCKIVKGGKEIQQIMALYDEEFFPRYPSLVKGMVHAQWSAQPNRNFANCVTLAICRGPRVRSCATVRLHAPHRMAPLMEVLLAATDKRHRSRGYGTLLANVIRREAKRLKCESIYLRADDSVHTHVCALLCHDACHVACRDAACCLV